MIRTARSNIKIAGLWSVSTVRLVFSRQALIKGYMFEFGVSYGGVGYCAFYWLTLRCNAIEMTSCGVAWTGSMLVKIYCCCFPFVAPRLKDAFLNV